jgi:short-subunit dehydrogenase
MPTIAIVGAGPGLGLSIAKVFGRNAFQVALISRTQSTLDGLAG